MTIEDHSSCSYKKLNKSNLVVDKGTRISKKNITFEDNYWKISGSHDGYLKKFKTVHEREIEFYPEQMKFVGFDKLLRKETQKDIKFDFAVTKYVWIRCTACLVFGKHVIDNAFFVLLR